MSKRAEIRAALEALAAEHGGTLTPAQVVEAARDPDSVLHDEFTWNTEEAAQRFLLMQARALIRGVQIIIRTERQTLNAPAYVRDPARAHKEQGYRSVLAMRSDADSAREVVIAEFSRAANALRRARTVATALALEESIDELLHDVDSLLVQVQAPSSDVHQ